MNRVRRRANDEKSAVRKAALQVLEAASMHELYGLNEADALLMHQRCADKVSTVRRQAVLSITALMGRFPAHYPLQGLWLDAVVPLILDNDTGVRDKAAELLDEHVLRAVVECVGTALFSQRGRARGVDSQCLSLAAALPATTTACGCC
jgi:hypothetical protein